MNGRLLLPTIHHVTLFLTHGLTMDVLVFGPWPNEANNNTQENIGFECYAAFEDPAAANDSIKYPNDDEFPSIDKHHEGKKRFEWLKRHLGIRRKIQQLKMTPRDDVSVSTATTAASSAVLSEHSVDSISSTETQGDIPLIQQRLLESGVELETPRDFEFVADTVSKEVIALEGFSTSDMQEDDDPNVKHVKTGIWQVTCLDSDGAPQEPFYIVTGVCMEDKVDTKKLRKAVFAGQKHSRRPKLSLAPTPIAEELAGFQSGTMAPICHSVKMKLFLEESIVSGGADLSEVKINCGSGMFGECLSISAGKFLEVAKMNPKGIEICPIIRKAKGNKS